MQTNRPKKAEQLLSKFLDSAATIPSAESSKERVTEPPPLSTEGSKKSFDRNVPSNTSEIELGTAR